MKGICFAALLFACLTMPQVSSAGECNARDYLPAPPGTSLMLTYGKNISADSIYSDGDETHGFNYSQNLGILRYVYFDTLFGLPVDYQALFMFNGQELDGDAVGNNQFSATGVMDPTVVSTIWPLANPDTKTFIGFTQFITFPVGEYDSDQVLNPGGNRWVFKEELGFIQGIGDKMFAEVIPSVELYTDNDDVGGQTQKKDPVYQVQAHLSYDITPKFWVSADYTYQNGGETEIAGVSQNDSSEFHKVGMAFSYKLSDVTQLLIEYSKNVKTENGPDIGIAGFRFLYIF